VDITEASKDDSTATSTPPPRDQEMVRLLLSSLKLGNLYDLIQIRGYRKRARIQIRL